MVRTKYTFTDPTQSRCRCAYAVSIAVDTVPLQKNMGDYDAYFKLWRQHYDLGKQITDLRTIAVYDRELNYNTRSERKREALRLSVVLSTGWEFTWAILRAALAESRILAAIKLLQEQQVEIVARVRAHNAGAIVNKRQAAKAKREAEANALAAGRFWACEAKTLKDYFSVPFDSRALVDVSERWRAALFVETESENCSNQRGTYWHRSVATGLGYLCGIDDNGDEWGFRVPANYGDTVETAMADVFGVDADEIKTCYRQGEILFCPATPITEKKTVCTSCGAEWTPESHKIDIDDGPRYRCGSCHDNYARPRLIEPPIFTAQEKWQIVESHEAWSPGLEVNRRWMRSAREITIIHPTHQMLVLPAGSYRVYVHVENAD